MKLKVDGREYPAPEFDTITFREAKLIKDATGLRMGELSDAFEKGDTDALVAMLLVAMQRATGSVDVDAVYDLGVVAIEVVEEPEPEDESPLDGPSPLPAVPAEPEPVSSV